MPRIFISYRRNDSQESAGRIHDYLANRFGRYNVFTDVDSIPVGNDFIEDIMKAVRGADVVLVVIGPQWAGIRDSQGRRRLDHPRDVVRLEIEIAIREERRLIPVLVQNADMPTERELPQSIQPLQQWNAAVVRSGRDFAHDVKILANSIDSRRLMRILTLCGGGAVMTLLLCLALIRFLPSFRPSPTSDEQSNSQSITPGSEPESLPDGNPQAPLPPVETTSRGIPLGESAAEARIVEELESTTEFEFIDTPLNESLDFISDLHNIQLSINEQALAKDGIIVDEPINITLSGVPLRIALRRVLQPLTLTYIVRNGYLDVTTETEANQFQQTRAYKVRDLTARGYSVENLTAAIEKVTGTESSENTASVREGDNDAMLFVTTIVSEHDQIEGLLSRIRRDLPGEE